MKDIYFSIIHSKLNYGIELYANTYISNLEKLITLNNKILRILQQKNFRSHAADLYSKYNSLPVNLLFKFNISVLMHKCLNNIETLPAIFQNYIAQNNIIHNQDTRSKNALHVPQVNKTFGTRATNITGVRIWNSLPISITSITNLYSFKKTVA